MGSPKDENNVLKSAPRHLLVEFDKPETSSYYHGNGKGVKSRDGYWVNPDLSRLRREANFRARKFLREKKQKKSIGDSQSTAVSRDRNKIKHIYTNANSLWNKLTELIVFASERDADIICVTETHFGEMMDDCESGRFVFRMEKRLLGRAAGVGTRPSSFCFVYKRYAREY